MTSHPRDRRRNTSRRSVRTAAALLTVSVVATTAALTAGSAAGDEPTVLTPIGGGYETSTLAGFSRAAAEGASGPTVDLVVVPSAYGDSAKERAANLTLAQETNRPARRGVRRRRGGTPSAGAPPPWPCCSTGPTRSTR